MEMSTFLDHIPNNVLRVGMGVAPISAKTDERRLQLFSHVQHAPPGMCCYCTHRIAGELPQGRQEKRFLVTINHDLEFLDTTRTIPLIGKNGVKVSE